MRVKKQNGFYSDVKKCQRILKKVNRKRIFSINMLYPYILPVIDLIVVAVISGTSSGFRDS